MHKIRTIIPESLELNVIPMYISYRFSNLHKQTKSCVGIGTSIKRGGVKQLFKLLRIRKWILLMVNLYKIINLLNNINSFRMTISCKIDKLALNNNYSLTH